MIVRWTPEGLESLLDVQAYLARLSPAVADKWMRRIVARADTLATHPRRGTLLRERENDEIRQIWEGPYRLLYYVRPDVVHIALVIHGARLVPPDP